MMAGKMRETFGENVVIVPSIGESSEVGIALVFLTCLFQGIMTSGVSSIDAGDRHNTKRSYSTQYLAARTECRYQRILKVSDLVNL